MVKPSGAQCNLDCTYCFYLHKESLLDQPKTPRIGDEVLEAHIRQYIAAQDGPSVVFSWQGGEPTLMGLDFFRRVVELQARYQKPGQAIENDLQTNGILLDDEWCAFLKAHRFLVGLSIDGPRKFHDHFRKAKGGQPTFDRVMQAATRLHRHEVPFCALCVVNRVNARKPLEVYRFLRDVVQPRIIQFIPGVEPKGFAVTAPGTIPPVDAPLPGEPRARPGGDNSIVTDWSVDPYDWGHFLCRVWDEWFRRDYGRVFVDQFENVVSMLFGHGPQKCVNAKTCGRSLALEHNGDLYSCDHYVYPEYRLGNILATREGELARSAAQQTFAANKSASLPSYCRRCPHLELCWGDCPRNRFLRAPGGEPGLNYLCSGLRAFYAHATGHQAELSRRLGLPVAAK